MSTEFWDYVIKYANLLYNISPHKSIQTKIPNEILYNKKVDLKIYYTCNEYWNIRVLKSVTQ